MRRVAEPLGLTLLEAASGIHRIANARMMRALRAVSSEKGRDPRDFALIAYGGAGPVHAAGLAEELGIRTVLVPPLAGLFTAVGLLFARPEFHEVRTCHLDATPSIPPWSRRSSTRWRRGSRQRSTGARGRVAADAPTSATAARAGRSRSTSRPGRSTAACSPRCASASRTSTSGSTASGQAGSPVEIRALRLAALGDVATTQSFHVDGANGAAPDGSQPASTSAATISKRRCARARRSARRRSRARCSWTSTTRPSSSRPAGRSGATRRPGRSCWSAAPMAS